MNNKLASIQTLISSGQTIMNQDLAGESWADISLVGAVFIDCSFAATQLTGCDLSRTVFIQCDFSHSQLTDNTIQQSSFVRCIFNDSQWRGECGSSTLCESDLSLSHWLQEIGRAHV